MTVKKRGADDAVCREHVLHPEALKKAADAMPDPGRLFELAGFFKVLGDPTRVRILWALEHSELCVCDLAELLNMTKSAVSHQLRLLREVKLVKVRRDGKNAFYSPDDQHVRDMLERAMEHVLEDREGEENRK